MKHITVTVTLIAIFKRSRNIIFLVSQMHVICYYLPLFALISLEVPQISQVFVKEALHSNNSSFFLIGLYSTQVWITTTAHGTTRKRGFERQEAYRKVD